MGHFIKKYVLILYTHQVIYLCVRCYHIAYIIKKGYLNNNTIELT